MAKLRVKKESEVGRYTAKLGEAKSVVLADLSQLKVADSTDLRRKAKSAEIDIVTTKKTLLRIAVKQAKMSAVEGKDLPGSVSLLLAKGDEVAPARVVEEFRKTHENLKVLGGVLESKWMTADEVLALSKLPSKEQLIATVVGTIRAPLSGLVGVLQGNLRQLVYALNAIKDSKSA